MDRDKTTPVFSSLFPPPHIVTDDQLSLGIACVIVIAIALQAKSSVNFIDFVARPMYQELLGILPRTRRVVCVLTCARMTCRDTCTVASVMMHHLAKNRRHYLKLDVKQAAVRARVIPRVRVNDLCVCGV
jgi:hypothetical protein